jgi:hypothetical protein
MTGSVLLKKSIIPGAPMDTKVADLICDDCGGISILTVTKNDLHDCLWYLECVMYKHIKKTSQDKKKEYDHNHFTLKWIPLIEKRLKETGKF